MEHSKSRSYNRLSNQRRESSSMFLHAHAMKRTATQRERRVPKQKGVSYVPFELLIVCNANTWIVFEKRVIFLHKLWNGELHGAATYFYTSRRYRKGLFAGNSDTVQVVWSALGSTVTLTMCESFSEKKKRMWRLFEDNILCSPSYAFCYQMKFLLVSLTGCICKASLCRAL